MNWNTIPNGVLRILPKTTPLLRPLIRDRLQVTIDKLNKKLV